MQILLNPSNNTIINRQHINRTNAGLPHRFDNSYIKPTFQARVSEFIPKDIPNSILDNVQKTITQYKLFDNKVAHVAYSGGKDSFFLCQALKSLGYDVRAIIIDIGYGTKYEAAINNLKKIGLNTLVLSREMIKSISENSTTLLHSNFNKIKSLSVDKTDTAKKTNICTPCYNSKIVLLTEFAKQNGIKNVAFGHHATDSLSSMLKSYYMYVDRWKSAHKEFNISNFAELINSEEKLYKNGEDKGFSKLVEDISELIDKQKVGTDEPVIRQIKDSNTVISRPLFRVFENDIIKHFIDTGIIFPQSECFFMGYRTRTVLSPRELIQYKLLDSCPQEKKELLLDLCEKTLNPDGTQIFDVRNNRSLILGADYKNSKFNTVKL